MGGSTLTLGGARDSPAIELICTTDLGLEDKAVVYAAVVSQQEQLVHRGDFIKVSMGTCVSSCMTCTSTSKLEMSMGTCVSSRMTCTSTSN